MKNHKKKNVRPPRLPASALKRGKSKDNLNFESSGFKNIKIEEKVDFMKLYESRKVQ